MKIRKKTKWSYKERWSALALNVYGKHTQMMQLIDNHGSVRFAYLKQINETIYVFAVRTSKAFTNHNQEQLERKNYYDVYNVYVRWLWEKCASICRYFIHSLFKLQLNCADASKSKEIYVLCAPSRAIQFDSFHFNFVVVLFGFRFSFRTICWFSVSLLLLL